MHTFRPITHATYLESLIQAPRINIPNNSLSLSNVVWMFILGHLIGDNVS